MLPFFLVQAILTRPGRVQIWQVIGLLEPDKWQVKHLEENYSGLSMKQEEMAISG